MQIKKNLTNFEVTRTRITTSKEVSKMNRLALDEAEIKKWLEGDSYGYNEVVSLTNDTLTVEETYDIKKLE